MDDSVGLLKVSEALLDVLGLADFEIAQAVHLALKECGSDCESFARNLVDEFELDIATAQQLSQALTGRKKFKVGVADDVDRIGMAPEGDTDTASEVPDLVAADGLAVANSAAPVDSAPNSQSLLEDPILAAKMGRFEALKSNEEYMRQLREEARREYLRKREEEQFELQERFLTERVWLRQQEADLSTVETRDIQMQQHLLGLAKRVAAERQADDEAMLDSYTMPSDYDEDSMRRLAVLKQKFRAVPPAAERKRRQHGGDDWQQDEEEVWQMEKVSQAAVRADVSSKISAAVAGDFSIDFESEVQPLSSLLPVLPILSSYNTEGGPLGPDLLAAAARRRAKAKSLRQVRKSLPVYAFRKELMKVIKEQRIVILVGETGSGKTTQVPQYLAEVGYGELGLVVCTQPRRVAAMSVAARVADEMDCKLGSRVGYTIRFEDRTSESTVIKYVTDGMLVREFLTDATLSKYSVVMVDEAHERTLHTDILFALLKDLSRERPDTFRLIISSATLEAEKFAAYFDEAPIFEIPGRLFPVDIYYLKTPEANYLQATVVTILQIHTTQPLDSGDILVFLPGQQEIEDVQEMLVSKFKGVKEYAELLILPIYASLPSHLQAQVFVATPPGCRKVVLATNIAETSITIENIVYVIDPGLVKQNSYNARTGLESLQIIPCSKAAVNQRAGRAGRVKPGKCFRLFPKATYEHELEDSNIPEVLRSNLGNVVLSLMSMNINDVLHFDFMDPPAPDALINALDQLFALGALNVNGEVTKLGLAMSEFPLDPMFSKMILHSERYGCNEEACIVAAMLNVGNSVFFTPADKLKRKSAETARMTFRREGGDMPTLVNVYRQWENEETDGGNGAAWCQDYFVQDRSLRIARDIKEQLTHMVERVGIEVKSSPDDGDALCKAITSGFFPNAARLNRDGSYKTLKNKISVHLHPQSALFVPEHESSQQQFDGLSGPTQQRRKREIVRPDLLIFAELVFTTKEYMRNVIEVKPQWLLAEAGHYYSGLAESLMNTSRPGYAKKRGR